MGKFIDTGNRMMVSRCREKRNEALLFTRVSVWDDEKFQKMDSGDGQIVNMVHATEFYTENG